MLNKILEHGTLVFLNKKGVLLLGKSGSGKSDLALRLIEIHGAVLVADDVVELKNKNGELEGSACENIAGLLEVRGVGIAKYKYQKTAKIKLVVLTQKDNKQIERLPEEKTKNILGVEVPCIKLNAAESSAPQKILVKLRDNLLEI